MKARCSRMSQEASDKADRLQSLQNRRDAGKLQGFTRMAICVLVLVLSTISLGFGRDLGEATMPAIEEILTRMEQRNEHQISRLASYQARRRYSVAHALLGDSTYAVVEERYQAPESRQFRELERGGSAAIRKRLFSRLLQVEQETTPESARRAVDLCRSNYEFRFLRIDTDRNAYVFEAAPLTKNPYLFHGTVWIHAPDFAVLRIEGEPARSHSSLIRRSHFVHEFALFGEFWLPVRHRSEASLWLFGKAVLEITYFDYHWQTKEEI